MLPSSGYFQSVPCPFYNNGLCERHHCQYRHVKKEMLAKTVYSNLVDESLVTSTSDDGRKSDLLKMVDIAIQKAQQDVERNKAALEAVKYSSLKGTKNSEDAFSVNYTPTPVSMCVLQKEKPANKSSLIPEYRPTPIAQLKKLQKRTEKLYDPVNNFSTPVPPTKRKKNEYDPSEVKIIADSRVLPSDDHLEHYAQKKPKLSKNLSEPSFLETDNSTGDEDDLSAEFSDDVSDDEKLVTSTEKKDVSSEEVGTSSMTDSEKLDDSNAHSSNSISTVNEYNFVDKILLESKKSEEIISSTSSNAKNITSKITVDKSDSSNKLPKHKNLSGSGKLANKTDKCSKSKRADKVESKTEINTKPSKANTKTELGNVSKAKEKSENKNSTKSLKINNESNIESNNTLKMKEKSETRNNTENSKKSNEIIAKDKKTKSEDHLKQKFSKSNKINSEVINSSKTKEKTPKCDKPFNDTSRSNSSKKMENTEKLKDSNFQKSHISEKHKLQKSKLHKLTKETSDTPVHGDNVSKTDSKTTKHECSSSNKIKTHVKAYSKLELHKQKSSCNEHSKKREKKENSIQVSKAENLQNKSTVNDSKSKKHSQTIQDEKNNETANLTCKKMKYIKKVESSDSSSECDNSPNLSEETAMDVDSDFDEHDTYEECWRIFNESPAVSNMEESSNVNKVQRVKDTSSNTSINEASSSKKRIAHQPNIVRASPSSSASRLSPGQVMQNRFLKLQEMHRNSAKSDEKKTSSAFLDKLSLSADSGKKRIAHVPNAFRLAAAAQKQKQLNRSTIKPPTVTLATTSTKGEKRIAHIPAVARSNRPIIPAEYGSKVPCNIRQRYLDTFIDECLKFCNTEDEAYQTALEEEKSAFNRSANKNVYLNVAVNTLKKLRKSVSDVHLGSDMSSVSTTKKSSNSQNKIVSHDLILGGRKLLETSVSFKKKKEVKPDDSDVKGVKLYNLLKQYILTEEQLDENGFPRQHPSNHGQAVIVNPRQKNEISNNPLERTCCRCHRIYRVTVKGNYVREEECVYHCGRLWNHRIAGTVDSRYSCCEGDCVSEGCCVAQGHVFEDHDCDNLKGYVKTFSKSPPPDGNYGVYSLDCEMCYSTAGIELTRITVIAPTLEPIYETMVKPENPILDYNTRFSGITEKDLLGVSTTIGDVQAVLLSLFNSKTILIGHSLENDFKALRLIHRTVVDTSVVFPHKRGPPYKRALRTLTAEYLDKIIQNSVDGHDSQEDALACMELMIWKIKKDIKKASR